MLTRRETILGGALTLMWSRCACADTAGGPYGFGCTLEPAEAERLLALATEPQLFDSADDRPIPSSGDRTFDYALAQTLSRLTDMFGVLPGFCFYDDSASAGAYATNATRMKRADGTVFYGKRYLAKHMQSPESPEAMVTATCAHEFGHIVQYKHGINLSKAQPTAKRQELHADFFAGYFAGARKLQKPDYPAAVFAVSRHAIGDFSTGKDHHGTPDERVAAIVRGFETAYKERRSFADAITIGVNYASRL